jgi:hypothetical protein
MVKKKASSKKSKPTKKATKKVAAVKKPKSLPAKKKVVSPAPKKKKKYVGKKRGRKPSSPNRYNDIKQAISKNYLETVNRKIKRYELKIIYNWIKDSYGNQSLRYVLMNIDLIIDSFWKQYCNLYPIEINNYARFFEWYNFKNFLFTEKKYHYPTDIIQVDLNAVGLGTFEFFFEDYTSKCEEYYEMLKAEGIKRESPPPALYLVDATCDISLKGNVFKYQLLMDADIPKIDKNTSVIGSGTTQTNIPPTVPTSNANTNTGQINSNQGQNNNQENVLNPTNQNLSGLGGNTEIEIQKERIKAEFNLREQKLTELRELLKAGVISFDEYMRGIKEV